MITANPITLALPIVTIHIKISGSCSTTVSIIRFLLKLRESAVPGVGSIKTASFPTESLIDPPFKDKALTDS